MAPPIEEQFNRGLSALQAGRLDEAERAFRKVLQRDPRNFGTLNLLGVALMHGGKFPEAEQCLKTALKVNATNDATFNNYGMILKAMSRLDEAVQRFGEAVAINPGNAFAWNNRGTVFSALGRHAEAAADFDRAIALDRNFAEAVCNKGNALGRLKRYDEALAAYDRALALRPDLPDAWLGRGNVYRDLGRHDEALTAYDRLLALRPESADGFLGRGNVLFEREQFDAALAAFDRAVALAPGLADAWLGRANVLYARVRYGDAAAAYEKALRANERLTAAWLGFGNALTELSRLDEAIAAYDRALAIEPGLPEVWLGRGNVLFKQSKFAEAADAYDKALAAKPAIRFAAASRYFGKLSICDWTDHDADTAALLARLRSGEDECFPFMAMALPVTPADQLQFTRDFAVRHYPPQAPVWNGERYAHDRIRVAYLSSDLRDHAIAYLATGLFEQHDRARFETIGISFGAAKASPMRERIEKAFDRFVDVQGKTDAEMADIVRALEVDIAVGLNGFTLGERTGVFARRPAPVQAVYLGYPGTMACDYIDYAIADSVVIPPDHEAFYTEKVVRLPETYQVNDSKRAIAERTPTRAACGLPDSGFVFCCFNNTFKITPDVFDVWMRLLKHKPGSCLWLFESHPDSVSNLRREAERRGIAAGRLVFAPRMSLEDHLARQRLGDLFLDTLPCNAITTASDALWAGLPVLTCLAPAFPGRVAASLLNAIGLPDLVTSSLAEYERLAMKIADEPALLADIKTRLQANRTTQPLFDTARFTRNLERAYVAMHARQQRSEPPAGFDLAPE